MKISAVERSFARATLYRFLSLGFAMPSVENHEALLSGLEAATLSGRLLSPELAERAREAAGAVRSRSVAELVAEYRGLFTYSASPDCPLNECAYGAKHIYQEVQQLADVSGFYQAFGLEIQGERPDGLTAELEFGFYLALKEGYARENGARAQAAICRDAHRTFLREHLGRWADNIGRRVAVLAPETAFAAFARLLSAFAAYETDLLKTGPIAFYQEAPNPPEALEEEGCLAEVGAGAYKLDSEDVIGELIPVGQTPGKTGG